MTWMTPITKVLLKKYRFMLWEWLLKYKCSRIDVRKEMSKDPRKGWCDGEEVRKPDKRHPVTPNVWNDTLYERLFSLWFFAHFCRGTKKYVGWHAETVPNLPVSQADCSKHQPWWVLTCSACYWKGSLHSIDLSNAATFVQLLVNLCFVSISFKSELATNPFTSNITVLLFCTVSLLSNQHIRLQIYLMWS